MAYIVPTAIAFPPTGDAKGTTHRPAERTGAAYPNVLLLATAPIVPTTGQVWPRGAGQG